jgi:hypothetical protein
METAVLGEARQPVPTETLLKPFPTSLKFLIFAETCPVSLASIFHVDSDEALKSHPGPHLSCEDATVL